jgi:hypothetical protein
VTTLLFHDYEQHGLDGAVLLVREHLGTSEEFEVIATTSRNELLDAVARCQLGAGIALIDLQRDNHAKGNYVGLRVLEAIRRHPTLAARCRPMALTRWDDNAVIEAVRQAGAYGLIRRDELERNLLDPGKVDLTGKLAKVAKEPCLPPDSLNVPYTVIPEESELPIDVATPTEKDDVAVVHEFFPDLPARAKFGEADWAILRLYREIGDRGVVVERVARTHHLSMKRVNALVDRMRSSAAAVYRTPQPDLAQLADDLLHRLPHRRDPPVSDTLLAELPDPFTAARLCADTALVQAAWVEQSVLDVILAVRRHWTDPQQGAGETRRKASLLERVSAIESAIDAAAAASGSDDVGYAYAYGTLQLLDAQRDRLGRR